MWRKVPCEQQLDTGDSILSHRGNLYQQRGVFFLSFERKEEPRCRRKGIRLIFLKLVAGPSPRLLACGKW